LRVSRGGDDESEVDEADERKPLRAYLHEPLEYLRLQRFQSLHPEVLTELGSDVDEDELPSRNGDDGDDDSRHVLHDLFLVHHDLP